MHGNGSEEMHDFSSTSRFLKPVTLVLLVELLLLCGKVVPCQLAELKTFLTVIGTTYVDSHHLGLRAGLDVVPGGGVVLAVPDDIGATRETGEVP